MAQKLAIDRALDDYEDHERSVLENEETGMNPKGADEALSAFSKGYIGGLPKELRASMELAFSDRREATVQSISIARQKADRKEAADNSVRRIDSGRKRIAVLMEKGGMGAMDSDEVKRLAAEVQDNIDILQNDPWYAYSDEWAEDQREMLQQSITVSGIAGEATITAEAAYLTALQDPETAEQAGEIAQQVIEDLRDQYGGDIPEAALDAATSRASALIGRKERERQADIAEKNSALKKAQTAKYHSLSRDLVDRSLSKEEARSAWRNQEITEGQYTALYQQIVSQERASLKKDESDLLLSTAGLVDPNNTKHRNAVSDSWIEAIQKGADPMETALGMMREYSVFPKAAGSHLSALAANGTPDQKQASYEKIGELAQENYEAVKTAMSDQLVKDGDLYYDTLLVTGDRETAMSRVLQAQEARRDPELKKKMTAARKAGAKAWNPEDVSESFDKGSGSFWYDPILPEGAGLDLMEQGWTEQFAETYAETNDEGAAKAAADRSLKRLWGVTHAGGKARVVMHPPERFYELPHGDVRPGYIEKQLERDVLGLEREDGQKVATEITIMGELAGISARQRGLKVSKDDLRTAEPGAIRLVSDVQTAREAATGRPSYSVVIQTDTGALVSLGKRWRPDVEGERAEVEAIRAKAKEKLVLTRDDEIEKRRKKTVHRANVANNLFMMD